MSVIRQSEVLGRTARRRLIGMTASMAAAALEGIAVCVWFGLVVIGVRTHATALAGLGVLFCGSLLRAGVFGAAASDLGDVASPDRLALAVSLAAGWVLWLAVAEWVGGVAGVVASAVVLTAALVAQFSFERRVFRVRQGHRDPLTSVAPAALIAVGASTLLASAWFSDWTIVVSPIALDAVHIGVITFWLFAFLAHQRRFEHTLYP